MVLVESVLHSTHHYTNPNLRHVIIASTLKTFSANMRIPAIIVLALLFSSPKLHAQKPEKQISFAAQSKPHSYYVQQAELWWGEVEKNKQSEEAWYNYFRASRNAHGTADWRSDFIKESPYLRTGDSILAMIGRHIPGTFTHNYLTYLNQGIGTDNSEHLLIAYRMNPDFEGIHSSVVTLAESRLDMALRKKVNSEWHNTAYLSPQLLTYAYNVLQSLDTAAVLFTQHDNDTYPLWMLQDALGIRDDVRVINIDFLLLEDYRKQIYRQLDVPELKLGEIDLDEYHSNWRKVLTHVLAAYAAKRPVYLGMTVAGELYKDFEKSLHPTGLAYKFSKEPMDVSAINRRLYEDTFLLDYLRHMLSPDRNQANVNWQNINYLTCFKDVYRQYISEKKSDEARALKELSLLIAGRVERKEYVEWVEKEFR